MKSLKYALTIIVLVQLLNNVTCIHSFLDDDIFDNPFINFLNRQKQAISEAILKQTGQPCTVDKDFQGSCMLSHQCLLIGGRINNPLRGQCGLTGTCCTQQSSKCGGISTTKVSYFNSEGTTRSKDPIDCKHTVRLMSRSVCQIRLDFEEFDIAPPEKAEKIVTCKKDFFNVDSKLQVLQLCGKNKDEHVYIHVNASSDRHLRIRMSVGASQTGIEQVTPKWRIRITQLECPRSEWQLYGRYARDTSKDRQLKIASTAALDLPLLAPYDCLQYYTKTQGEIKSFSYDGKTPHPTNDIDYAICFEKTTSDCTVTFDLKTFDVSGIVKGLTIDSCDNSYLLIPNSIISIDAQKKHHLYCGQNEDPLTAPVLISYSNPGLLSATVHNPSNENGNTGFVIKYNKNC